MYCTPNDSVNYDTLPVGVTRVLIAVGSVAGVMCLKFSKHCTYSYEVSMEFTPEFSFYSK